MDAASKKSSSRLQKKEKKLSVMQPYIEEGDGRPEVELIGLDDSNCEPKINIHTKHRSSTGNTSGMFAARS